MQVPGINGGNSNVDCSHYAVRDHQQRRTLVPLAGNMSAIGLTMDLGKDDRRANPNEDFIVYTQYCHTQKVTFSLDILQLLTIENRIGYLKSIIILILLHINIIAISNVHRKK